MNRAILFPLLVLLLAIIIFELVKEYITFGSAKTNQGSVLNYGPFSQDDYLERL